MEIARFRALDIGEFSEKHMKVSGYILMVWAVFYSDKYSSINFHYSIMKKVFTLHVVLVKFDDQIQALLILVCCKSLIFMFIIYYQVLLSTECKWFSFSSLASTQKSMKFSGSRMKFIYFHLLGRSDPISDFIINWYTIYRTVYMLYMLYNKILSP